MPKTSKTKNAPAKGYDSKKKDLRAIKALADLVGRFEDKLGDAGKDMSKESVKKMRKNKAAFRAALSIAKKK